MSAADYSVLVLIPWYNAERWIGATLELVLAQTWENIEIVVVNDGSTDDSLDALRRYEFEELNVIDQPNSGQTAALNCCLYDIKNL